MKIGVPASSGASTPYSSPKSEFRGPRKPMQSTLPSSPQCLRAECDRPTARPPVGRHRLTRRICRLPARVSEMKVLKMCAGASEGTGE